MITADSQNQFFPEHLQEDSNLVGGKTKKNDVYLKFWPKKTNVDWLMLSASLINLLCSFARQELYDILKEMGVWDVKKAVVRKSGHKAASYQPNIFGMIWVHLFVA